MLIPHLVLLQRYLIFLNNTKRVLLYNKNIKILKFSYIFLKGVFLYERWFFKAYWFLGVKKNCHFSTEYIAITQQYVASFVFLFPQDLLLRCDEQRNECYTSSYHLKFIQRYLSFA